MVAPGLIPSLFKPKTIKIGIPNHSLTARRLALKLNGTV